MSRALPHQDVALAQLHCSTGEIPAIIEVISTHPSLIVPPVISSLRANLPLGDYHVRFTLGSQVEEHQVTLVQSHANHYLRATTLWQPPSAIPSDSQISAAEQRQFALIQYTDTLHISDQRCGQLIVVVHNPDNLPTTDHPEIRLQQSNGVLLARFAPLQERAPSAILIYDWHGEAGTYQVALPASGNRVNQLSINLCNGWQTQLFLQTRPDQELDLTRASLSMTRLGKIFQSCDHNLLLTESLRTLLQSTAHNPVQVAQDGSWSHFSNPLVGLLSGWLLLQSPERNMALLTKMIIRLKQLTGWTPDCRALAWATLLREGPNPILKGWRKELAALPTLDEVPNLFSSARALLLAQQQFQQVITPRLEQQLNQAVEPQGSIWLVRNLEVMANAQALVTS